MNGETEMQMEDEWLISREDDERRSFLVKMMKESQMVKNKLILCFWSLNEVDFIFLVPCEMHTVKI